MRVSRLFIPILMGVCVVAPAAVVPVPALHSRVTDLTGTLSPDQSRQLEGTLQQFEAAKGAQVVVLIVPSTGSEAIEQFSIRVADQWKIGRKGVDDGVILLVAKNDRTLRIEVGRGVEGALPDATASRIINEIIVPRFKAGDFSGGIAAGVDRIIKVINGEPLPPISRPRVAAGDVIERYFPILFFAFPIGAMILGTVIGRLGAGVLGGGIIGTIVYLMTGHVITALVFGLFFMVFIALPGGKGGARYGGGGSWSRGGGSWSRGGGGGFSGGGGSFGGGGASGRW